MDDKKNAILIVDDIPENIRALGKMLEREGYEVLVATNGASAFENAMASPPPDLILLDIMMPDMDGYEVCRRLKSDPKTRKIPVIFVSGLQDTLDKVEAFHAGGVDYIVKPFQFEEVQARVRTHLALRRQQESLEKTNAELRHALSVAGILNRKLIDMNEKFRTAEQLKSKFLSSIRTEINTPLDSIIDMAEHLTKDGLAAAQAKKLALSIQSEVLDLDFQMQNIFFAAELEAGKAQPIVTPVDVRSLVQSAILAFSRQAQKHSLEMHMEADDTVDAFFDMDAGMLRHILLNLLSNAVKFSPPSVRILVGFRIEADKLTLEVEDEGPGIPDANREEIFERFRQLETAPSHRPKGHGLGLSVVKALLDLLGGDILLSRSASGGARFTVIVPRRILTIEPSESSYGGTPLYGNFEER